MVGLEVCPHGVCVDPGLDALRVSSECPEDPVLYPRLGVPESEKPKGGKVPDPQRGRLPDPEEANPAKGG